MNNIIKDDINKIINEINKSKEEMVLIALQEKFKHLSSKTFLGKELNKLNSQDMIKLIKILREYGIEVHMTRFEIDINGEMEGGNYSVRLFPPNLRIYYDEKELLEENEMDKYVEGGFKCQI